MTEAENIKRFLSGNRRELISIYKLEKLAGVPARTLHQFLDGKKSIAAHHVPNLVRFLVLVGYQPLSNDHQFI